MVETDTKDFDLPDENILESLKKQNVELKEICEKFLDEISEIKSSEPYVWREILIDAVKVLKIQADLREKIETLRENRRQMATHWAEIMRFAKDREAVQIPTEPPDIFAAADDDWAEIIYEY